MIVADASSDPTTRDNKAIADLGVIAYLGVPLALPTGEVVGALAAIAPSPRAWTQEHPRRLQKVAKIATDEIDACVSAARTMSSATGATSK